jgi:hypothetical protein
MFDVDFVTPGTSDSLVYNVRETAKWESVIASTTLPDGFRFSFSESPTIFPE